MESIKLSTIILHQMVQHLERPSCMATSFYWWTHSELEEWTGTSVVNRHEVKMVTSLCLWLLTQDKAALNPYHGYLVTVLTPYRAQVCYVLVIIYCRIIMGEH